MSKNLTLQHILDGVSGYVRYALNHPFKDRVYCTDYSRRVVQYYNENGNKIKDPDMSKLAPDFFKSLEGVNQELIDKYISSIDKIIHI